MDVFIRGSRSNTRDWATAQRVSSDELPQLDEKQKEEELRATVRDEVRRIRDEERADENKLGKGSPLDDPGVKK